MSNMSKQWYYQAREEQSNGKTGVPNIKQEHFTATYLSRYVAVYFYWWWGPHSTLFPC